MYVSHTLPLRHGPSLVTLAAPVGRALLTL